MGINGLTNQGSIIAPTRMHACQTLVVGNGAILNIGAAGPNPGFVGHLNIKQGGTLKLETNSTLKLEKGSKVLIEPGGKLVVEPGANIILLDNESHIEIQGTLELMNSAVFTFTGNGFVRFNFQNEACGNPNLIPHGGCAIRFKGSSPGDKVLEIINSEFNPPANGNDRIVEFSVEDGKVEMGADIRMNLACKVVTFKRSIVTRLASMTGTTKHKGVRMYGNLYTTVESSTFEHGVFGMENFLTANMNVLHLNHVKFQHCNTGLYTYGEGVIMNDVDFLQNGTGWRAAMASVSSVGSDVSARNNQSKGIDFYGVNGGSLFLDAPDLAFNQIGVSQNYADLMIRCGFIQHNSTAGIRLNNYARFFASPLSFPNTGQVNILSNTSGINNANADYFYMDQGKNNLSFNNIGINGIMSWHQPTVSAQRNNWPGPGSPQHGVDFNLRGWNGTTLLPIQVIDNNPFSGFIQCPSKIVYDPTGNPGANSQNPQLACQNCTSIQTTHFQNVKLNDAVNSAIEASQFNAPQYSDRHAIGLFKEILTAPLNYQNWRERHLIKLGYQHMMTLYGHACVMDSIDDSRNANLPMCNSDFVVGLDLIDRFLTMAASHPPFDIDTIKLHLDKAFLYRMARRPDLSLAELSMVEQVVTGDLQAQVAEWKCNLLVEEMYFSGLLDEHGFADALGQCTGGQTLRAQQVSDAATHPEAATPAEVVRAFKVYPNPSVTGRELTVETPESGKLQVFDLLGNVCHTAHVQAGQSVLTIASLPAGVYVASFVGADSGRHSQLRLTILTH